MAGNTIGTLFRLTTFGESHGKAIGGVVDGCPPRIPFDTAFIQSELVKRKPGSSSFASPRMESDEIEILSGVFDGYTTGETAARVAGGSIAKLFLKQKGINITAFVSKIGPVSIKKQYADLDMNQKNDSLVFCPDEKTSTQMLRYINKIKLEGDTIGGIVTCIVIGSPPGLGEPVFDKLQADLARAMLSINAAKGFEYGLGFKAAEMKGSEHNDEFVLKQTADGKMNIQTKTNHAGGILGGISTGEDIYFNVAFKPPSSIMQKQFVMDKKGNKKIAKPKGRYDVCFVPRAVPVVEAMTALVIADYYLRNESYPDHSASIPLT
jgi:chorismate synthase